MHIQLQLGAHTFDVPETFLVVGARAPDPDLDFVLNQGGSYLAESTDNAFER